MLAGWDVTLEVAAAGVRCVSLHFPQGVTVMEGGSLTMLGCTSTGGVHKDPCAL